MQGNVGMKLITVSFRSIPLNSANRRLYGHRA